MAALKRMITGVALAAAIAMPLLTPAPAQAWWRGGWGVHVGGPGYGYRPGWGYHPGWGYGYHPGWGYGWRGGVYVGVPPVIVGTPAPYAYPYSPYRWIPGHYNRYGAWIPPHWGY
jgi:hypothetical protein